MIWVAYVGGIIMLFNGMINIQQHDAYFGVRCNKNILHVDLGVYRGVLGFVGKHSFVRVF